MKTLSTATLLAAALSAGLAAGARAQTVSSINGSYFVSFSESAVSSGSGLFTYTYNATLTSANGGASTNGEFVNSFAFMFANPNAVVPFTANSDSFTAVSQAPNAITFTAEPADPVSGTPADPGLSAANPTATFSFLSTFAPSAGATALAITPSGGSSSGPGPGVGNLFVGPGLAAAPEPGAGTILSLGALGLLGLSAVRARRARQN